MNHYPPVNFRNLRRLHRALCALREAGRARRFSMRYFIRTIDGETPMHLEDVDPWERSPEPHACGTIVCLAGMCALIGARTKQDWEKAVDEFATEWLDLDGVNAGLLFYGGWSPKEMGDITLDDAIGHLEQCWPALTIPSRPRGRKETA
jgi:hypothetical protein